ncbi:MAG TPA: alkaline phosphatase family protein [Candidatus Eisenbacteria bacterium]|nr:alkaline phosphatase family protein [Candidatus Eisenbacteria bacterium]
MATERTAAPLVILGMDAGDPDFIRQWAAQGYLPTIASIMERGSSSRTGGAELLTEHGVWVSIFSGISRAQHGYYYFRQLKPGTYDLQTVTGPDIDAPPFWSYLRGTGIKVAIIDAPDTRPYPGLAGIQLSDWATHNNWDPEHFKTAAEPPELLADVRKNFGAKLTALENAESTIDEDRQFYRQLLEQIEKKGALCRYLLARDRFDLIVVVFSASHAANHQFWRYRAGAAAEPTELSHAIRDVYHAIDREFGRILQQVSGDSNVFIVSSVGMEDHYPTTGLIDAFCRQLGYQASPDRRRVSLDPMDLARRLVPESWRVALSRRLPREKRERLLANQFMHGADWSKTTAFAIPASYTSFIRVNLAGREPQGTVRRGADYRAVLERLESDLARLIDADTGEKAVTTVARTVELFQCEPHVSLPDLFVHWKPGRFMERVRHPKTELTQKKPDFYRPSDHSRHGFVAAAGPSIKAQTQASDVEVLNLAPTFLSLLGEPVPPRMTGHPIPFQNAGGGSV